MIGLLEILLESEQKVNFILSNPRTVEQLKNRILSDSKVSEKITPEQLVHNFDNISTIVSKFLPWVVKRYCAGDFEYTDLNLVDNYLNEFVKNANKIQNKDINSYETLKDLNIAVSEVKDQKTSHDLKREAKSEAEKVYEDQDWVIIIPHTERASIQYGKGTRWCTASSQTGYNAFEEYNSSGPLYILISKKNPKEKYQFHHESGSYMNEEDIGIDVQEFCTKYPNIQKFFVKEWNLDLNNPEDWKFFPKDVLATMDYNQVKKIIESDPWRIQFIPEKFKTEELCLIALKIDRSVFKFIPEKFKTEELCLEFMDTDGYNAEFLPDKFYNDIEFWKKFFKKHPKWFKHYAEMVIPHRFDDELAKEFG